MFIEDSYVDVVIVGVPRRRSDGLRAAPVSILFNMFTSEAQTSFVNISVKCKLPYIVSAP